MPTPIAIAVVEHAGNYLIGQRPADVPLGGLWEFPGGKIETGESPEAAAVRECLEEAGLVVEPLFRYPGHVHEYDHDRVQLVFVACRPEPNSADQPREPFRWVSRQELTNYQFPAGNRGLLTLLAQPAQR
ncbi:MAG: (deoxy)nucleoside triphosphate pyrophosphohydrolase [Pirellulaceae bacterium]|jgi:8-oxo-dGTP diphosphatase|nr:(deoxy)nucleoside triphosphate pyrophosphohydrolase [Pirellulaceae bacterium]